MEDCLFTFLEGRWNLTRTISTGEHAAGTAVFVRRGSLLAYAETATLCLPDGIEVVATRNYRFEPLRDRLRIWFDEELPRLFHDLQLTGDLATGLSADGHHRCAPDDYASTYRFHRNSGIQITHAVRGPRKDYTIKTRMTRG